jgi:hypothetical protein
MKAEDTSPTRGRDSSRIARSIATSRTEGADELRRPAFYALRPGGWRDLVTILHPPYTAWHLSYVALGAAAAPQIHLDRLGAALGAFALAVGISAHALDELNGRPLRTRLSDRALVAMAIAGLGGAVAIGVAGVFVVSASLAPLVIAGALLVPAYNLELGGGRFHTDAWFAAAWGGFPALVGWWSNALAVHGAREAIAGAAVVAGCFFVSVAQRRLSTPVRQLRRRTTELRGEQRLDDGSRIELDSATVAAPLEGALRALSIALPALAIALVVVRA